MRGNVGMQVGLVDANPKSNARHHTIPKKPKNSKA